MKPVLYTFPGGDGLASISSPCLRVEMALKFAGVEYERNVVRSNRGARKVSVTGRLPMVAFDGLCVSDSTLILDELERRVPAANLSPADPTARMRDRLWEHYFNDHVYWIGYYMRWISPEDRERWLAALLGRAPFLLRTLGPSVLRRSTRDRATKVGIAGKSVEEVTAACETVLAMTETGLAGGPYLEGRDRPARGDMAAAAILGQIGFRDTLPDLARRVTARPAIVDYVGRVFSACSMDVPRWLVR